MDWKPSKKNSLPLYKQIANYIEARILNGEYPIGSRLPSERELAQHLQVNRSTINIAFDELRSLGLVNRIIGVGTVVSEEFRGESSKRLPNWDQYVKEGLYQSNNPLNQKIHQYIGTDESIINFAVGELSADLTSTPLMEEMNNVKFNSHLGYDHVQGNIHLRDTISKHMEIYRNIQSTSSSILVTSGAQQAIHLIIRCLLKPGDPVAIENPSYAYSLPIFHSEGLKTHYLDVHQDGIDPEQIISLYKKQRIKMIFLNPMFQNPTGNAMTLSKRKRIIEICTKYGIAIVEDDPYSILGEENQTSLKSLDHDGIVIYVSSLSKLISSGLRIGWILAPQTVITRLTDAKQQIDFGQSIFPQQIANNLLSSKHFSDHLINLKEGLKKKRDITVSSLKKVLPDDIEFVIPDTGIHLWCKVLNERINQQSLFHHSIKNGVVFAPGSTLGKELNYIRFTYSRVENNEIEEGIRRFAEVVKDIQKN